jgi:hypothetical protein
MRMPFALLSNLTMMECGMVHKEPSIQPSFNDRAAAYRKRFDSELARLKPVPRWDNVLRKLGQLDKACAINEWLSSPVSRPST